MSQFDNVAVIKKANVYFDGKCVSHTVMLPDGSRKSVGVILPASLIFSTSAPETMEIIAGNCRVKLKGESQWQSYAAGQSFKVPGESGFEIETSDTLHYVCHFH
jgi:uncharacterized protein YaiE (UPF0345 family)